MIDKIEDRFIFPTLRVASVIGVILLGIAMLITTWPNGKPPQTTLKDIQVSLNVSDDEKTPAIKLPKNLQSLDESNAEVVRGWAEGLKPEYRDDFLKGLESVLSKATNEDGSFDGNILNKYKSLELERLNKIELSKTTSPFEAAIKSVMIIFLMVCLVLFCNLLVLLKIARIISEKKTTA